MGKKDVPVSGAEVEKLLSSVIQSVNGEGESFDLTVRTLKICFHGKTW